MIFNSERLDDFRLRSGKQTTRMFGLAMSIHHCTGDSSQDNQPRKRDKRYSDWKGKRKTIFTDDMVLYIYIKKHLKSPLKSYLNE